MLPEDKTRRFSPAGLDRIHHALQGNHARVIQTYGLASKHAGAPLQLGMCEAEPLEQFVDVGVRVVEDIFPVERSLCKEMARSRIPAARVQPPEIPGRARGSGPFLGPASD